MNDAATIHDAVTARYSAIAEAFTPNAAATDCCAPGDGAGCGCYTTDLSALPADVTGLSLGCGDPLALAALEPGQTVLDLGSGGGIDCFLAAERVGPTGRVIGVDMTPAMLARAEANRDKLGATNVAFRFGRIEALPVDDATIDVILSNCVINLSPDKPAVFREAWRVLKPGGRLAVSDMVVLGTRPADFRPDPAQWSACVDGAADVDALAQMLRDAGFVDVAIRDKAAPTVELSGLLHVGAPRLLSAHITARKPAAAGHDRATDAYFADVAEAWDGLRDGFFTVAMRDDAIARAGLTPGSVVADLGTGTGFVIEGLLGRVAHVDGYDGSDAMLAVARRKFAGRADVRLVSAESQSVPAPDAAYDAVFANMYLHHVPDPAAALAEMARILKPGGRLVLTDLDAHDQAWMRDAMADRWLGFARADVADWLRAAGLTPTLDCAAGTCNCDDTPDGGAIALSIFVAVGLKSAER